MSYQLLALSYNENTKQRVLCEIVQLTHNETESNFMFIQLIENSNNYFNDSYGNFTWQVKFAQNVS